MVTYHAQYAWRGGESADERVRFKEGHMTQTAAVQDIFTQIDTETQNSLGNIDKVNSNMFFSVASKQ